MLDLSKIEAGKLELNPEPVNLSRLIDEVVGTAGQLAEKNKSRLIIEAQENLGRLTADSMREALFAERGSPLRGDAGLAGCCAGLNHCADVPWEGVGIPTVGAAAIWSERPCAVEFLRERRDRSAPLPKLNCIPRPTSLGR